MLILAGISVARVGRRRIHVYHILFNFVVLSMYVPDEECIDIPSFCFTSISISIKYCI